MVLLGSLESFDIGQLQGIGQMEAAQNSDNVGEYSDNFADWVAHGGTFCH